MRKLRIAQLGWTLKVVFLLPLVPTSLAAIFLLDMTRTGILAGILAIYAYSFVVTIVLGAPTYFILLRKSWTNMAHFIIAGAVCGLLSYLLAFLPGLIVGLVAGKLGDVLTAMAFTSKLIFLTVGAGIASSVFFRKVLFKDES